MPVGHLLVEKRNSCLIEVILKTPICRLRPYRIDDNALQFPLPEHTLVWHQVNIMLGERVFVLYMHFFPP